MNDFLLPYEKLYHCTHPDNREGIAEMGLEPRCTTEIRQYDIPASTGDPAQVCFCLKHQVANFIDQARGHGYEPIICEIDPVALLSLRVVMDWTMKETQWLFKDEDIEPFHLVETDRQKAVAKRSLNELSTLASLDTIPPRAILIKEAGEFQPRPQTLQEWLRETNANTEPKKGASDPEPTPQ